MSSDVASRAPRRRPSFAALAALALATTASCHHHPSAAGPPTHAAATMASAPTDPALHVEVLETEDGPISIDALDPQLGPRDARCVIVVFSDFECPFCKDVADVLARLHTDLPRDVRIVFKHFPLPMHVDAKTAAIASQVVFLEAGTDAFWRFHDQAFAHQYQIGTKTLTEWAEKNGASSDAIATRGPEAEQRVVDDIALGRHLGLSGTPRVYINARSVSGAYPYEQMRSWVGDEL